MFVGDGNSSAPVDEDHAPRRMQNCWPTDAATSLSASPIMAAPIWSAAIWPSLLGRVPDRPRGTIDVPTDRVLTPETRWRCAVAGREAITHWQLR